jgi:hypothetical protein
MDILPDKSRSFVTPQEVKPVTSRLFEAYLACPTKCFLRSIGEMATGNDFTIWSEARGESYRREGAKRLMAGRPPEFNVVLAEMDELKKEQWHFAIDRVARAENLEASLQLVQRMPPEGDMEASGHFFHVNGAHAAT